MIHFDPVRVAALVAIVCSVVQALKTACEWMEAHANDNGWLKKVWTFFAHSGGPVILSGAVAVVALLPAFVSDGQLTLSELWQLLAAALGLGAGASGFFVLLKKLRPKPQPAPATESSAVVTYTKIE